jgi:transposase
MDNILQAAGVDVSKAKLDVLAMQTGEVFAATREVRSLRTLGKRLVKAGVTHVGMEYTGGYERVVDEVLSQAGLDVRILDPGRVRHYALARGVLAKTDPLDARAIGAFLQAFPEEGRYRKPESAERIAQYLRVRELLLKSVAAVRNQLEHMREPGLREFLEKRLESEKAELKALDKRIEALVAEDEDTAAAGALMRSVKGVGPVVVSTLLALMPELGSLGPKQAARLARVAPADNQSGKSVKRARVRGGRDGLGEVLHMAALSASRHNPAIRAFAERLLAAGKPHRLVMVACARKLIVILNAMLRDRKPWIDTLAA